MDIQERLGRALRQARETAGLTQGQLAEKMRVAQSTISKTEAGKQRRMSMLERAFGMCGAEIEFKVIPAAVKHLGVKTFNENETESSNED